MVREATRTAPPPDNTQGERTKFTTANTAADYAKVIDDQNQRAELANIFKENRSFLLEVVGKLNQTTSERVSLNDVKSLFTRLYEEGLTFSEFYLIFQISATNKLDFKSITEISFSIANIKKLPSYQNNKFHEILDSLIVSIKTNKETKHPETLENPERKDYTPPWIIETDRYIEGKKLTSTTLPPNLDLSESPEDILEDAANSFGLPPFIKEYISNPYNIETQEKIKKYNEIMSSQSTPENVNDEKFQLFYSIVADLIFNIDPENLKKLLPKTKFDANGELEIDNELKFHELRKLFELIQLHYSNKKLIISYQNFILILEFIQDIKQRLHQPENIDNDLLIDENIDKFLKTLVSISDNSEVQKYIDFYSKVILQEQIPPKLIPEFYKPADGPIDSSEDNEIEDGLVSLENFEDWDSQTILKFFQVRKNFLHRYESVIISFLYNSEKEIVKIRPYSKSRNLKGLTANILDNLLGTGGEKRKYKFKTVHQRKKRVVLVAKIDSYNNRDKGKIIAKIEQKREATEIEKATQNLNKIGDKTKIKLENLLEEIGNEDVLAYTNFKNAKDTGKITDLSDNLISPVDIVNTIREKVSLIRAGGRDIELFIASNIINEHEIIAIYSKAKTILRKMEPMKPEYLLIKKVSANNDIDDED